VTPYIDQAVARQELPVSPGQLANCIAQDIADYVHVSTLNFQSIAEVRGAVTAALNEFERRVAEPYEQLKLEGGGHDPYGALVDQVALRLRNVRAEAVARELRRDRRGPGATQDIPRTVTFPTD